MIEIIDVKNYQVCLLSLFKSHTSINVRYLFIGFTEALIFKIICCRLTVAVSKHCTTHNLLLSIFHSPYTGSVEFYIV
jgi:hypothetical protein